MNGKKRGFTFIEIIVVIAVTTILILLASSWFGGETTEAKLSQIKNDTKVVDELVENYATKNTNYPAYKDITTDIIDYFNQGKLYNTDGKIADMSKISTFASFKLVSGEFVNKGADSSLPGVFVSTETGQVFYLDVPMEAPGPFDQSPSITASSSAPTNLDVDIDITYPTESINNEYKIGSGEWNAYTGSFTITSNTVIYARGFNADGIESDNATLTISNIDKIPPIITLASYNTNPTNQDITVVASVNEGTLNQPSHTFSSNGSFTFVATDSAGNTASRTVTISNINKVAPVVSVSLSASAPTNQDVVATASTDKGTLNETSYIFTENGSFEFIATDEYGNTTSQTVMVDYIDKTPPTVTFAVNGNSTPSASQGTQVLVTDSTGISGNPEYQWTASSTFPTAGAWNVFNSGDTLTKSAESGNYYLHIRATDTLGNEANVTSNVFVLENVPSPGDIAWKKSFIGTNPDWFESVAPATDGGYVTVGHSSSVDDDMDGLNRGGYDAIMVKYDSLGNVAWKKIFGGTNTDQFYSIAPTSDGGYVAVGHSRSNDMDLAGLNKGNTDAIIVKYDASGNVLWNKNFGGTDIDGFESVVQTSDSGYIVSGWSKSIDGDLTGLHVSGIGQDGIIVKYDSSGNVVWNKNFGGASNGATFYSAIQTSDSNYIVVGSSSATTGDLTGLNKGWIDGVIVKYDSLGNKTWNKNFGGTGTDSFAFVVEASDGNYIVSGNSNSTNGDLTGLNKGGHDAVIVKYDSLGNLIWNKNFGGTLEDSFISFSPVSDGGYVAVGYSISNDGELVDLNKGAQDAIIVKYDSSFNVVWNKNFGGTSTDRFLATTQAVSGEYVAIGYSTSSNGDMTGLSKAVGFADAIIVKYLEN